jgi:hypothetical protein
MNRRDFFRAASLAVATVLLPWQPERMEKIRKAWRIHYEDGFAILTKDHEGKLQVTQIAITYSRLEPVTPAGRAIS